MKKKSKKLLTKYTEACIILINDDDNKLAFDFELLKKD